MSDLAAVLPFLAALKKNVPDFSGMTSDDDPATLANGPNRIGSPGNMLPSPQGPPAPPPPDQMPQADLNAIAPPSQQQTQQYLSGIGTDTGGERAPKFKEATGHFLLRLLQSGLQGGLNGLASNAQTYAATGRNAGFGGGYQGAQMMPFQQAMMSQQVQRGGLENQLLSNQVAYAPLLQRLGLLKSAADLNKTTAETGAIGIKNQLENAQALAARYKEDPGSGTLIDLQTGQPVNTQGFAPLSDQEAAILGKQSGQMVPLKLKNQANEMANRGIHTVQANGRSLLVDNQGNTIKDMGAATPMAVINAQMSGGGGAPSPEMRNAVDMVGSGRVDLATALAPFRRFPGASESFLSDLNARYPNYNQATYGVSKKTLEYFTTGAGATQLTAFRTAIAHADLLDQAAQAVNNGDSRTLAGLGNRFKTEFGSPNINTFDVIRNTYTGEVTKAINNGHITEGELSKQGGTMPDNTNYETIHAAMQAYKALMASKAQQLMQQYDQGRQGQPAFPQSPTSTGASSFNPSKDFHPINP